MSEFGLIDVKAKKDSLTGKVGVTESLHFRVSMAIVAACILALFTLDMLDFELPGWANFLMSFSIVIGYAFAFMALLFSRNAGSVKFAEAKVHLDPKKPSAKFPDSPIPIDETTEVNISIIQSYRFILWRTLLHISMKNGDEVKEFGFMLNNKQEHEQYLEVIDSWYRAGYEVKEFDQLGNRVFKLNQGSNYEEIQRIKREYEIEW